MIFCRGCGKEIHETAPTCPHCGAPQSSSPVSTSGGFFELGMQPFSKYADFSGRARRKEYWYYIIIFSLIAGVTSAVHQALYGLYVLATFIPTLAAGVRRMHDTDRSGWWIIVPVVGLVFCCLDSQPGSNRFGDNPKGT